MDTNLRKSKKVRAFIYRMIAAGAFCTMFFSALMGREAFTNLSMEGLNTLTGDIYYLTEFREYISTLYVYGMAYVGLGDDEGYSYPMDDEDAQKLCKEYASKFKIEASKLKNDMVYYVENTKTKEIYIDGNVTYPLFSEFDGHLILPDDVRICCYWNGKENLLHFFNYGYTSPISIPKRYYTQPYRPSLEASSQVRLVLALKDKNSYFYSKLEEMQKLAQSYQKTLITFFTSLFLFLISSLCCLFSRQAAKEARADYAAFSGKIWLEVKLGLLAGGVYFCWYYKLWFVHMPLNNRLLPISHACSLSAFDFLWGYFLLGVLLYLLYKDFRHNGRRVVFSSLLYKIINFIRELIAKQPCYRKAMGCIVILLLCTSLMLAAGIGLMLQGLYYKADTLAYVLEMIFLLSGILLLFVTVGMNRFTRDTYAIAEKLSEIQSGKFSEPLQLKNNSLLSQAAKDLNAVEDGIENAVEQQNRSNKMRVELITNVSHDLKTPLTSIINYADLLCEENLPAPACEYATSLQAKAYRLKSMVQDVFELSKATSGNLPIEITRLDLVKLIRQTLADMDERIQESTLTFKLNIAEEPLMIEADGEKLYRVFQNLFINALQYSLEHSRVHIQLSVKDGCALAKVKNISFHEMDFEPDEIMERFVRADNSRTTEGSGLGLSIAQSFTENCGGSFRIELDADMFTACVSFPLSPNETTLQAPNIQEADHEEHLEEK